MNRAQLSDDVLRSATELHRMTVAHSASRAAVGRQLSQLGRQFIQLTTARCARNEERIKQSMERVDRLPGWRMSTRHRIRAAFK